MQRPKRTGVRVAIIVAICGSMLACNDKPATATVEESAPAENTTRPEAPAAAVDNTRQLPAAENAMNSDEQIAHAKQSLAKRLGATEDEIQVTSVRAVQWRNGAAGCPKPGMSYTMVITPGVQILLSARGAVYNYHAAGNRAPQYCPPDRVEAPAYGQGEEVM